MNPTKKIILVVVFALIYIWGFIHGYVMPVWGGWMLATAVLYMLMHFLTLSWRDTIHQFSWVIWIFIVGIAIFVAADTHNVWLGFSALFWNAALWSVVHSLEDSLTNRRKFRSIEFFQTGGAVFSIFFTLSFITAFIGRNQQFNLTCVDINSASNTVVNYTTQTLSISVDEINNRKDKLINYISMSSGDNVAVVLSGENMPNTGGFLGMIEMYKQQLIDATITNQKDVSQKVCQVFVDQINNLYEKPGFRVSVILLMFLVISPLLRLTLYIISAINMAIFSLLRRAGVYVIVKENAEVDKIV